MRFRSPPLLSLLLFFTSSACGTSHLAIGQSYLQRGNLPVAVEYFDAGLVEDAKNEELRDAMIMAEQSYQWQLRDDIDRLKDAGAYLLALARLTGLIERGHRLKTLRLPGEEPESLSQELREITKKATKQLSIDLDKRAGRSQILTSDLRACRQLQSLGQTDAVLDRRCAQLQKRLQIRASIKVLRGAHSDTQATAQDITQKVLAKNPELIQFVDPSSNERTAEMRIHLGAPKQSNSGWHLTKRDAYHTWIEKRDRKGRLLKKTVTIPVSAAALAKAKKEKKKAPEPKKVSKQLYKLVQGEYRYYASTRSVSIPYRITIEDLRKNETLIAYEGQIRQESKSAYHKYHGHPRATKVGNHPGGLGKHTAVPLQSADELARVVLNKISSQVADAILKRVE